MAKYRIIRRVYPNGQIDYEVQKKILGLFWWNFENVDATKTGFYSTLEEAKIAIKMRKEKPKKTIIDDLEDIFHEPEESEDESIRKWLIGYFQRNEVGEVIKTHDILAWLEKQGEEPQGKTALEAIKEEIVDSQNCVKPTNKVEPKFNVDDWVIHKSFGNIKQIKEFDNDEKVWFTDGTGTFIEFLNGYRLWTIQDAKDGDVLAGSKNDVILMFRGIGNTEWDDVIDYHCYYDCYRECFIVQEDVEYWGDIKSNQLVPATKEQRDLLFTKMKEAGYEWNFEY